MGATELSEALNRVLPFTAKEDNRPVLQCVFFRAKEGKLTLTSADGFRLAVVTLPFDGEGQALISRDDLKGITNALRRAKRVNASFEGNGSLEGKNLILDTDLIRYKLTGVDGSFPDYEKLIPTEFNTLVSFDTHEAIKAVSSLKVLADDKSYPIDLIIGNGKVVMANPDDKGQAEINADTQGEVKIRVDGGYLTQALKACGGMVELKLVNAYSAMLFATNGYQLVVMPMETNESIAQAKREREAKGQAEAKPAEPAEAESEPAEKATDEVAEAVAEAVEIAEQAGIIPEAEKSRRKSGKRKAREPVAVA